jgi:hypothetical protein
MDMDTPNQTIKRCGPKTNDIVRLCLLLEAPRHFSKKPTCSKFEFGNPEKKVARQAGLAKDACTQTSIVDLPAGKRGASDNNASCRVRRAARPTTPLHAAAVDVAAVVILAALSYRCLVPSFSCFYLSFSLLFTTMSPRPREEEELLEEEVPEENRREHKKRRKFAVFSDSAITDAERREVRNKQRHLASTLRSADCQSMEQLEEARRENNDIFASSVRYTREAVLDADNVDLITTKYAQQVEKHVQVRSARKLEGKRRL